MKTAIVMYSQHHNNTRKLVEAIKKKDPEVKILDVSVSSVSELDGYDRIGVASGIYYSKFAKPLMEYLNKRLPEGKEVFSIYTCGQKRDSYTNEIKALAEKHRCNYIGEYGCLGFDTFGPFKLVGGLCKGHPDDSEVQEAVDFYIGL